MCAHHVFLIDGKPVPAAMTMRGDAVDEMFKLSMDGPALKIEYTVAYAEILHKTAAQARDQLGRG